MGCDRIIVRYIFKSYFVAIAICMLSQSEDVVPSPCGGLPAATRRNWKQASLVRRNAIALQMRML